MNDRSSLEDTTKMEFAPNVAEESKDMFILDNLKKCEDNLPKCKKNIV